MRGLFAPSAPLTLTLSPVRGRGEREHKAPDAVGTGYDPYDSRQRMTPREELIRWRSFTGELVGVYHPAASGRARAAAIVVHPFAEEKKFSHRVLANLARELARRDVATLRFDLSGAGDSTGDTNTTRLDQWRGDITSACVQAEARAEAPPVLVGLRLGATLALIHAAHAQTPPALVLWQPVIDGRKYVDEILRRRMIKEMMTTGRKATGRDAVLAQLDADGFLDLDGLAVGKLLIEDIASLNVTAVAKAFSGRALCVQIAFNAKVTPALKELAATLTAAGAQVETIGIREQVIWDRVELVKATELIRATADWIARP